MTDNQNGWDAWRREWRPLRRPDARAGDDGLEAHLLEWLDPAHRALMESRCGERGEYLWTMRDGDGLSLVICAGHHVVDRMGYLLTEKPHQGCGATPQLILGDPEIEVVPEEMDDEELAEALEDFEFHASRPGDEGRIGMRNLALLRAERDRRAIGGDEP